jgi:hypothetical protein
MGDEANKTTTEEHARWVKRLFEVSELLATMSQEISAHNTTKKPSDSCPQNASKEGTHEPRKSRSDDQ